MNSGIDRNHFSEIVATLKDAVVSADAVGRLMYWNRSAELLFGFEEREFAAMTIFDLLPDRLVDLHTQAITSGAPIHQILPQGHHFSSRCRRKNGQEFPVDITLSTWQQGEDVLVTAVIRDTTDNETAWNEVRNARDFLENIFRTTVNGIYVTDARGRIIMANAALTGMLGYAEGEISGMHPDDFSVLGPEGKLVPGIGRRLRENRFVADHETEWRRKDGSPVIVSINAAALRDNGGNLTGIVASVRDVTARKRAEYLLDSVNTCLLDLGPDIQGNISTIVATACRLIEHSMGTVYMQTAGPSPVMLCGRGPAVELLYRLNLRAGIWRHLIDCADNAPRQVSLQGDQESLFPPQTGIGACLIMRITAGREPAGVLASFLPGDRCCDSTELKVFSILVKALGIEKSREQVLDKLRENQQHLEVSERNLKLFSGKMLSIREEEKKRLSINLHDELGSMAIGVGTRLSILAEELRTCNGDCAAERIAGVRRFFKQSISRLRNLAVDLRPPELDIIGLPAALREYCKSLGEELDVVLELDPALTGVELPGDVSIALYRVIQESLTNIVKHARASRALVRLHAETDGVCCSIADNGQGFQSDAVLSQPGSTALGLRGMRERIETLGGQCDIASAPGAGACISVFIPVECMPEAVEPAGVPAGGATGRGT